MGFPQGPPVAPYTGAWIETLCITFYNYVIKSHPTRVRGLKHVLYDHRVSRNNVAPYTGAWIETRYGLFIIREDNVAPYTGAWIETKKINKPRDLMTSHPTRVRGLKLDVRPKNLGQSTVAPYTGAWIETTTGR